MASSLIHMTIAQKTNEKLKKDKYQILIGSIAPDIAKLIGRTKKESHFLEDDRTDIPNIDKFLKNTKNIYLMISYSDTISIYIQITYGLSIFFQKL